MTALGGRIYRSFLIFCEATGYTLALLGRSLWWTHRIWETRKQVFEQIRVCTVGSFLVTILVSLFAGLVLAFTTGEQLSRIGQEAFIGDIVGVTMVREMGPVMTGFILTGLLGSKIAAEIGTMKVSEEIDALEVMSINPIRFLVMPRIVAVAVACPLLTLWAYLVGIATGGFLANAQHGVSYSLYIQHVHTAVDLEFIMEGLTKAVAFGLMIATIGSSQGLRATQGPEGVGRATMRSVVIATTLVLILDWIILWIWTTVSPSPRGL